MSQAVAEFQSVSKTFCTGSLRRKSVRALAEVNLRLPAGEIVGLVGPNRAGKTTLLKILLSLCRPTNGTALRFGRTVNDLRSLGRVGYVHENQAFPRYLTAAGLLEHYGAMALVPYEEVERRIPVLLEQVGLADRSQEPISQFSKGMVQRLGLAQALINDPDLLVLDEPSEGLDLEGRQLVRKVLLEQRRAGKTVLLVSHLLADVEQLCDRVIVLMNGRVIHDGPVSTLRRPANTGDGPGLEKFLEKLYEKGQA